MPTPPAPATTSDDVVPMPRAEVPEQPRVSAPAPRVTDAIRRASPTAELNAIFTRVQKQPLDEAEFEQAIARFEQYRGELGNSTGDARLKERARRMEEIIRLRMELRDTQRKNRDSDASITAARAAIRPVLEQYERQRIYTIIGRLIPSTVYDGTRLPLLYRVHSPEPGTSRTLGYLQADANMDPTGKLDLTGKLGQIVGVVGETRFDETLKATLITATKVDVVSLAPLVRVPADRAATAPAPAKTAAPLPEQK